MFIKFYSSQTFKALKQERDGDIRTLSGNEFHDLLV